MKLFGNAARQTMVCVVATLVIFACIGVWTAAAAEPARAVIDRLDSQLLTTMQGADDLGFDGRYRKLAPIIDDTFDLPRIAKLALGGEWKTLDAAQQKAYVAKFRKDTIATYASRFDGYDGQKFEVTGASDAAGGRRQVKTDIVEKNGKRTPISYVLANEGGQWRIINVVAGGVSDLALKRGQYTSAIRSKGADGFLEQFDKQLAKYPTLPDEN
ncbi:ABC transporter substrate-binding protein [Salinisphaera aquimarina]|uniref:ABC transporter substrate-binding protein n=1 Tax=Salinisphaera aquimarina TaxID=2094031 RepID=A0ABV7ET25_9GAMM